MKCCTFSATFEKRRYPLFVHHTEAMTLCNFTSARNFVRMCAENRARYDRGERRGEKSRYRNTERWESVYYIVNSSVNNPVSIIGVTNCGNR